MPGLQLTPDEVQRLWQLDDWVCTAVLKALSRRTLSPNDRLGPLCVVGGDAGRAEVDDSRPLVPTGAGRFTPQIRRVLTASHGHGLVTVTLYGWLLRFNQRDVGRERPWAVHITRELVLQTEPPARASHDPCRAKLPRQIRPGERDYRSTEMRSVDHLHRHEIEDQTLREATITRSHVGADHGRPRISCSTVNRVCSRHRCKR